MRRFFGDERDFVQQLRAACAVWSLSIAPDSFLGKGATSRVFRVTSTEGQHALKIACGKDHVFALEREYLSYLKLGCAISIFYLFYSEFIIFMQLIYCTTCQINHISMVRYCEQHKKQKGENNRKLPLKTPDLAVLIYCYLVAAVVVVFVFSFRLDVALWSCSLFDVFACVLCI
jgi:hypothetical protein